MQCTTQSADRCPKLSVRQFLLVAPASSRCCPTFLLLPPEPVLTRQVTFIQGHLVLFAHLLPQSSKRLHGKQTAARLQRFTSFWTFCTFVFPQAWCFHFLVLTLRDELHAAVLKRLFKSLWAIVLVMLHLANSTNKYRSSWKRKHSTWQATFSCCFLCLASCHITKANNSRFTLKRDYTDKHHCEKWSTL